jgi:hypothetical protein
MTSNELLRHRRQIQRRIRDVVNERRLLADQEESDPASRGDLDRKPAA